MDQEAERALIERCRTGDERAFSELVEAHKDLVHALVWRLARDRSQVDDLAQDVFLKIHRGLPYFRGEARLASRLLCRDDRAIPCLRTTRRRDRVRSDARCDPRRAAPRGDAASSPVNRRS